ncbi:MAG: carotenoid biosynthesis protein [Chloroflexia bacterium]
MDKVNTLIPRFRRLSISEQVMLGAFGIFCFVYPFAILLLSFDWMPFGMEWMSSLLLAMLGVASWAWLVVNFGRGGLLAGATVFVLGLTLEYVGVSTGVPFGQYRYTGVLVPELPGGLPLAIGFAWLLIVVSGLFTAQQLLSRLAPKGWIIGLLGATLAVGLDLLLEPVAYHIKGYWQWLEPSGSYYGVPWSNFATWFVAAFLMNLGVYSLLGQHPNLKWNWLPSALYGMNVVMFGLVNLTHGFWVAGTVALVLIGVMAVSLLKRR